MKEMDIMKKLHHPNLVKMYGICVDKLPFYIILVKWLCSKLQNYSLNIRDQKWWHQWWHGKALQMCYNFESDAIADWNLFETVALWLCCEWQEHCKKGDLKKHLESFKQGTGELIRGEAIGEKFKVKVKVNIQLKKSAIKNSNIHGKL